MTQPNRPAPPSKVKEALDTALELSVEGLEAVKGIIVDVLSVPGTGLVFDTVIVILEKIQTAKSNRAELASLENDLSSLVTTLSRLAEAVQTALPTDQYPAGSAARTQAKDQAFKSASLAERMTKLAVVLTEISAEAGELNKRKRFSRILHSSRDAGTITDMKARIAVAHRHFQIEGDVMVEAKVTEALSAIKTVIAQQRADEEERVLNSIPRADGALYRSAANTSKAQFLEGTREQIMKWLEEWVEGHAAGNGAHPICVLVGGAGTGKSTIASEFSKRLEKQRRLAATFFFTHGTQDLNSPAKFFSTICSQLARSQPALRVAVVDAAREHLKRGTLQQLEYEFEDLLRKPLSTLSSLDHAPIFVVVDALDECTEEGPTLVPTLLRLLLSAALPPSPLRILLTSRPEPHYIHQSFTASDVRPHIFTLSLQDSLNTAYHDIEHLIRTRLTANDTGKEWIGENPMVVWRLARRSEGLFIYAQTAVDFLLLHASDKDTMQERYDLLLTTGEAFGRSALDALYHNVLDSVFPPEERYPKMQERLKRVLGYLVALQEPVSPATLEALTGMPTTESVPILNKLRSVVLFVRDDVHSNFRIIHASFREFLVDRSRAGDAFYVSAEEAHGRLAEACISTMRSFREEYWKGPETSAMLILHVVAEYPSVAHFLYAFTYRDDHLKHRNSAPHDTESQPTDEDHLPPIPAFLSYWRDDDYRAMWDLARTVAERMRGSLPAGSLWQDVLSALYDVTPGPLNPYKHGLVAYVSIMVDIHGVMSRGISEAHPAGTTCRATDSGTTLDDRHMQTLTKALEAASEMRGLEIPTALNDAHGDFHRAIIAAGLTPRHRLEDCYGWIRPETFSSAPKRT